MRTRFYDDPGQFLRERGESVFAANGALPAARVCAEALAVQTHRCAREAVATRLHEVTDLKLPTAAPGGLRLARGRRDRVGRAVAGIFQTEAGAQAGRVRRPGGAVDLDDARLQITQGRIHLWVDPDDRPVHVTAVSPSAYSGPRIGPVYTPAEHRGNGYAAAAVAQVAAELLVGGARVCLFTDRANPTANRLYAALGFEPVVGMAEFLIEDSLPTSELGAPG